MNLTAQQREVFRIDLLRVLEGNSTLFGSGAGPMAGHMRLYGFDPSPSEVLLEILYLVDKGLVAPVDKSISPENRTWRLTAAGRDYLANHG